MDVHPRPWTGRLTHAALGIVLVAVIATGCASSGSGSPSAASSSAATAEAEASQEGGAPGAAIELWSWNNEGAYPDVHEDAEVRFVAANPGSTVKRTYLPFSDYITKFKASVAADAPPCIAQIPWAGEFRDFVGSGEIIPLTDVVTDGFPAFFDPIVDAVSIDGDVWAIPLDVNTLQIAYNKTVFDRLGLTIPAKQSDLQAIVNTLEAEGLFGIAMGTKDKWSAGDLFFAQVAYTDGTNAKLAGADAGTIPWDDPAFLQAADNVASMVREGIFAPGANSMDAFVGNLDLFASQRAAMMYPVGNFVTAGVADKVGDTFEWGLFPFPPPDDVAAAETVATGGIAEMFVVTKDCPSQEQAIEFLRYLVNEDGGKALVANDFIPSWDYPVPTDKSPLYQNMVDAQSTAMSRVIYTTAVYTALLNAMQGVMDGSSSGTDVISALVEAG
jgi:raffinose/stachyose/melibiose transport system substrate-binding protein